MIEADLSGVMHLVDPNAGTPPCAPPGTRSFLGELGNTTFIVTLGPDGHCEASVSCDMRPATDAQCRAFFRKLGREPEFEDKRSRFCRMFVVHDARKKTVH